MRKLLSASLLTLALVLAGCSSEGSSPSPSVPEGSIPLVSPAPEVSGDFGTEPTVEFPSDGPSDVLQRTVLVEGAGEVVPERSLVSVNYFGQVWDGTVFDQSFQRGTPSLFVIGDGAVIPGWDKALVGVKEGSRVLLSIPPEDAYGEAGSGDGVITGTDTLVFVIDVINFFDSSAAGDPDASPTGESVPGLSVEGDPGTVPDVTIDSSVAPPTDTGVVTLLRGSGEEVALGQVVVQYVATSWEGKILESTWAIGTPAPVVVGDGTSGSPLDMLVGVPVGSRVAVTLPPTEGGDPLVDTAVVVLDVVAQVSVDAPGA